MVLSPAVAVLVSLVCFVSCCDLSVFGIQIDADQVIELPLISPELFTRVGIKAPKGVLLYAHCRRILAGPMWTKSQLD